MTYEKAMAEIVKFDDTDVITTSGVTCYGNVFRVYLRSRLICAKWRK